MAHDALITLSHVTAGYNPLRPVLRDITLEVNRGDFLLITGPNGGGKTTLLRTLLKLLKPRKGQVVYHGDFSTGYLPQKSRIDTRFPIVVQELVASGLEKSDKARVRETLELIGLQGMGAESIGALSGGQLQRALMGRAIISNPDLLVLDEPLSYVDKAFEEKIYDILSDLAQRCTIIVVSHDQAVLGAMATRHILVDHGITPCHHQRHEVVISCAD